MSMASHGIGVCAKRDQREEGPRAGDFEVAEGQHTRLLDGEFAGFPTIECLGAHTCWRGESRGGVG
jgi:hypothetical protein